MMGVLTFVVLLMAIGTGIQRFDGLEEYFGKDSAALSYQRDEAIVRANALSNIDVLANDLGINEGDRENLVIVVQPKCGRVFVHDGVAQYLPAERCAGSQAFKYAISGRDRGMTGEVFVVVRIGEPTQRDVAANAQRDIPAPVPMAPRSSEQRVEDSPSLLGAQGQSDVGSGGLIIRTPAVPRPTATEIAGLPDTASGAGSSTDGSGSAAVVAALDASGQTPSLTAPSNGLPESSALSGPPVVPQSDRNASRQSTTGALGRNDPTTAGNDDTAIPRIIGDTGGLDSTVPRLDPAEIGTGGTGQSGFAAPTDALASVRELGNGGELAAVDTTSPAVLNDPNGAGTAAAARRQPCAVQPALTLKIRPAGITDVIIESPCHAGTAAELSYENLRFGIAIDSAGAGSFAAAGFQQASDATLRFAGGENIAFNIPFLDTERLDRVALIWDLPIKFELHAFEFGAVPGSAGHVRSKNPRTHRDVRRQGGGYLIEYQPVSGVGQSVDIYSYWHRNGSQTGVIQLALGIDGPKGAAGAAFCGDGAIARPDFSIMRSVEGQLERSQALRLAPLDCAAMAGAANRYISDAVDDLIVLQK